MNTSQSMTYADGTTDSSLLIDELNRLKDFVWQHILPYMCLIGIFANILNILVFCKRAKGNNSIYKYLLVHSIAELVYLTISFVYFFFVKKFFLPSSYFAKMNELYSIQILTTMIAMFMITLELFMMLKGLMIVSNRSFKMKFGFELVVIGLLAFSALSELPYFLISSVRPRQDSTSGDLKYEVVYSDVSKLQVFAVLNIVWALIRGLILPLMLMIVCLIMLVRYKGQLNDRHLVLEQFRVSKGISQDESSYQEMCKCQSQTFCYESARIRAQITDYKSTVRMMIVLGFFFLASNLLVSFTRFQHAFLPQLVILGKIMPIITNVVIYSTHSFHILIYYFLDARFNLVLISLFTPSK